MATKTYRARNRVVELEELEDVVAVRGDVDGEQVVVEGQDRFQKGGWRFLPRSAAAAQERAHAEGMPVARILRKRRGGELVLNLNRATVKFGDGVAESEVAAALASVGATIVQALPIAKNLYTVEFEKELDVFTGMVALAELPICEFAEPELVAAIAGR